MIIHVSELSKLSEELIAHLRAVAGEKIDIPVDYYWNLTKDQKYNPYEQPSELTMGQLSDDWSELHKVINGDAEPISYHLVWLTAILRALGEYTIS